jgi:hypothetical protein
MRTPFPPRLACRAYSHPLTPSSFRRWGARASCPPPPRFIGVSPAVKP